MTFLSVGDGDSEKIRIVVVITVHFTVVIRPDITIMFNGVEVYIDGWWYLHSMKYTRWEYSILKDQLVKKSILR